MRLNSFLAQSAISIHAVREADPGFEARFSPIFRRYEYRITDTSSIRDPRTRHYTLWMDEALDVDAMNTAAQSLLGLHDWTTYCKPREGATRVRDLQRFDWHRDEYGVLVATIQADAFCHNMVRNLVGVCVAVGRGRLEPADAVILRDQRVRTAAFAVLPPQGLTLAEVGYPDAAGLALRAEESRRRRDPV
jgi:tRNA pseudouridine38-40 synthase